VGVRALPCLWLADELTLVQEIIFKVPARMPDNKPGNPSSPSSFSI
jgi:hypothetical protein